MPVYQYKGLRCNGKAANGSIDADSPRGARLKLKQGGIYPVEVVEQGQNGESGDRIRSHLVTAPPTSLSAGDLAILTRQLGTLLVAGLPLVEALGILIEQMEKKAVHALLTDIREQIREGKAMSSALACYPRDFTGIYLHMVRAGEASGALDQILFRLADFLEGQEKLKSKVTNAVMYPALMLAVGVTVLFFLMTFVIPKITAVFTDLGQALPWPTQLLIALSGFLGRNWIFLLVGMVLVIGGIQRVLRTSAGRARADRLLLSLPLIGEVSCMVAISRLTSTLATMLASGVQLLEALDVTKRVMSNVVLEHAVEVARGNIREGESIAEPLKRSGVFPPLVTHMIAVGEKSGEMEDMLRRISQIYDNEVDRVVTRLTSLIEPVMILLMGGIVFFIVVAILLPIFQMSEIVR